MALINRLIECMLENNEDCQESIIKVLNSVKTYDELLPMENMIISLQNEDMLNEFYKIQHKLKRVKYIRDIRTYFPPTSSFSSS